MHVYTCVEGDSMARLWGAQMLRCAADAHSLRAASSRHYLNGGAAGSSCGGSEDRPRPPSVTASSYILLVSSCPTDPSTAQHVVL